MRVSKNQAGTLLPSEKIKSSNHKLLPIPTGIVDPTLFKELEAYGKNHNKLDCIVTARDSAETTQQFATNRQIFEQAVCHAKHK